MSQIKDFSRQLKDHAIALEQRYGPLQRSTGTSEKQVMHTFGNMMVIVGLSSRDDDATLRRLRGITEQWGLWKMRMQAWEDKIDFAAYGLTEKPSEAGQGMVDTIDAFLEQIPHAKRDGGTLGRD